MARYINGYIIKKKLTEEDLLCNAVRLANCFWERELKEFNESHIPMGYRAGKELGYNERYLTMFRIYEKDSKDWAYEICSSYQSITIWKNTDFSKNPEYKGDALSKVVPYALTDPKRIGMILKNQPWMYW